MAGWDAGAVIAQFGEPAEKRTKDFVSLAYNRASTPAEADEQWIYPLFDGMGRRLVFLKLGQVVLAVEEWSDY